MILGQVLLPATATTVFTARAETVVSSLICCNVTGGAPNLTVYVVPKNQSAATVNTLYNATPIAAGATLALTLGITLSDGDRIMALSSVASAIAAHAFGMEL